MLGCRRPRSKLKAAELVEVVKFVEVVQMVVEVESFKVILVD